MIILRFFGWFLIALALASAAVEAAVLIMADTFGTISAYSTWDYVDPMGLRVLRGAVKQGLHPVLWDPILLTILRIPAWLLFGAPGVLLVWLCRRPSPPTDEDRIARMMSTRPEPEHPDVYLNLDELRELAAKPDAPVDEGEAPRPRPHKVVPFAGSDALGAPPPGAPAGPHKKGS